MAEGSALEMRCAGNCTEGSNPSRSVPPRYEGLPVVDQIEVPEPRHSCRRIAVAGRAVSPRIHAQARTCHNSGLGRVAYGHVEFEGRNVPFHGFHGPDPFSKSISVMMSAGLQTALRLKSH